MSLIIFVSSAFVAICAKDCHFQWTFTEDNNKRRISMVSLQFQMLWVVLIWIHFKVEITGIKSSGTRMENYQLKLWFLNNRNSELHHQPPALLRSLVIGKTAMHKTHNKIPKNHHIVLIGVYFQRYTRNYIESTLAKHICFS